MRRLVALLLVVAACSGGTSDVTTSQPPETTPATTGNGTLAPITVPSSTVTATTLPPRPELSEPQVVYFFLDSAVGSVLVPVWRDESSPQGVDGAIETLFAGPTPSERLGVPALSTAVPSAAQVLDVSVVNELATVDLTEDFYSGGPPPERLAQVVFTATRFDGVEAVAFRVEGEPFAGLPGGADRSTFGEVTAPVFVDEPAYGGPITQPGRLKGEAIGSVTGELFDESGLKVADFDFSASGFFDRSLAYSVGIDQDGELVITDGAFEVSYPVQLRLPEAISCSAAGLSPEPEPQEQLPAEVAATRVAIVEAAVACDFDALAALAGPDFVYSFGEDGDPASFWRREESVGIQTMRLMVQLLNTPAVLDTEFFQPTYLWPSAFRAAPSPADFDLLEGIIIADDLALYREFNEYLDLRIGIAEGGSWDFAVAGD